MSQEIAQTDISKLSIERQIFFLAKRGYGLEDIALRVGWLRSMVKGYVRWRDGWPSWWLQ